MKHTIIKAAEEAQAAFWIEIKRQFPCTSEEDIDPGVQMAFDEACTAVTSHWVELNVMGGSYNGRKD